MTIESNECTWAVAAIRNMPPNWKSKVMLFKYKHWNAFFSKKAMIDRRKDHWAVRAILADTHLVTSFLFIAETIMTAYVTGA